VFVKGYCRSVILDIQRGVLDFIPNELYEIYEKYNKQDISCILSHYNTEEREIVKEYIDFLIKNEYAILGTEHDAKYIADLSIGYNYCGQITNCVCEYSDFIRENIELILNKIDKQLSCSAFQLLCSVYISVEQLTEFLKNFEDSAFISHIEVILPYSPEYNDKTIHKLVINQCLINKIILYNSPFDKTDDQLHTFIIHTQQNFSRLNCGIIAKEYFTQNMFHITEALHYNTCLNRKLHIDKDGNLKNCPFSSDSFGNVLDDELEKKIKSKSFQKLGNIKKDEITVCKDCEFRYICTDCRVFIKDLNDIYSQPAKCTYNPYISKWKDEKGYVTVEEWLKTNKT
jgi:SPASM domain peptide maturase of grasp-with-spasm system